MKNARTIRPRLIQINETFIENVAEGRAMTTDEVRALATGLTFTGLDAVENGLADEVGTQKMQWLKLLNWQAAQLLQLLP